MALPPDRRTKYLQNRCSFMRGICTQKSWSDISIRGRENFPLNLTDRQTDRQRNGHLLLKSSFATNKYARCDYLMALNFALFKELSKTTGIESKSTGASRSGSKGLLSVGVSSVRSYMV